MPATQLLAFIRSTALLTDDLVLSYMASQQIQISEHFALAWGQDATCLFVTPDKIPEGAWQIWFQDHAPDAGELGFHDDLGNPTGYVFVADALANGSSWTVTASHEVLELLADPLATRTFTNGGEEFAAEVCDACLTGDTVIPLLDGAQTQIKDLVGREEFYVYSSNDKGEIQAGRGHSARVTRRGAELIRVILDNEESFKCTPDHLIMMRDGTYKMAAELSERDSLMPLYRRRQILNVKKPNLDYDQVFDSMSQKWKFTHRIVQPRCPYGYVRHHRDFNRFNNSPDNIQIMTWREHTLLHQARLDIARNSPRAKEVQRQRFLIMNASHKGKKRPELIGPHNVSQEARRASGSRGRVALIAYNKSASHRSTCGETGRVALRILWQDAKFRSDHVARHKDRVVAMNSSPEHHEMLREVLSRPEVKRVLSATASRVNHERWHVRRDMPSPNCDLCLTQEAMINHKVVRIESCPPEDVYDLTVDDYHNFAIGAGIFVHNCEDDQFAKFIAGHHLSNFVLPSWFDPGGEAPFTAYPCAQIVAPYELAPGGYIGVRPIGGQWSQQFPDGGRAARQIKGPASRTLRRFDQT